MSVLEIEFTAVAGIDWRLALAASALTLLVWVNLRQSGQEVTPDERCW